MKNSKSILFLALFFLSLLFCNGAVVLQPSNLNTQVRSISTVHRPSSHSKVRVIGSGRPAVVIGGAPMNRPFPPPRPNVVFIQSSQTAVIVQQPTVIVEQNTQVKISDTQLNNAKNFKSDLDAELAKRLSGIKYLLKINSFAADSGLYSANITLLVAVGDKKYNITSGAGNASYSDLKAYFLGEIAKALAEIQKQNTTVSVQK